jgi:FkbM family methyltransferase
MIKRILKILNSRVSHLHKQCIRLFQLQRPLGVKNAVRYLCKEESCQKLGSRPIYLRTKLADHPLMIRPGSSDFYVFNQIFVELEYKSVPEVPPGSLIVDAGANVGYSACYFLSRFADSKVIALEPDSCNAKALRENLTPYGDRAIVIEAALWSHDALLSFTPTPYRDGREWSRQVIQHTVADELNSCRAISLESLIVQHHLSRIEILKVDIEGAEGEVFSNGTERWLEHVNAIVIELHNDSMYGDCEAIFHQAVPDSEFRKHRSGELTICERIRGALTQIQHIKQPMVGDK